MGRAMANAIKHNVTLGHPVHPIPLLCKGVEWGGRWMALTPFYSCARSRMGVEDGRHAPYSTPVQKVEWGGKWDRLQMDARHLHRHQRQPKHHPVV